MARFVVRRLFAMVAVMFVISLLTFLIFEAIPNGCNCLPYDFNVK